MAAVQKIIWVVNYNKLSDFLSRCVSVNATGVAIRADNDLLKAIPAFHAKNIKVFGWRWPSAMQDAAMKEADKVVGLYAKGLDGYFVDPEGEPGKPYDWNKPGLDGLAKAFCSRITAAGPNKPFGTTSHYRAKKVFPKLPWSAFFQYSTVLLPQAYWRVAGGVVGHGIPQDNYRVSIDFWKTAGGPAEKIVPMAGEIAHATAAEINAYAKEASAQNIDALHFYTSTAAVKQSVWDAIKNA